MNTYGILTELFNGVTRFRFPYNESDINRNGIYIMFEEKESYERFDRVVRIGSHRGPDRLFERIDEHFVLDDHRNSIFRKHLGRCLLTIDSRSDYIARWDLNIKSKADKAKNLNKIDQKLERIYEERITAEIRNRFSFAIIPNLPEKNSRERLEAGLIATFAKHSEKQISPNWIGNHHPDIRIRNSGLWNIQHLNGAPLNEKEVDGIFTVIGKSRLS